MKKQLPLIYLFLIFLFIGCNNEDMPTCGCDSKIQTTIPESANLIGQISYKTQIDPLDDYYNNTFWIGYNNHRMIICNEDFLNDEFDDLKISGETAEVQFSGYLKEVCKRKIDIAEVTYQRIILTSIQRL